MKEELFIKLKILKLYKELFTKKLSAKDIENIYIEYLKLKVQLGDKIPRFNEKNDKYRHVNNFNYVLDIHFPECINNIYLKKAANSIRYSLGFISGEPFAYTDQSKLDNLVADLETLNINWFESTIEQPNEHGGYKIVLYSDGIDDFYMLRQNTDASWSGKIYNTSKIIQLKKPEPINDFYKLVKTLEIVKPTIK